MNEHIAAAFILRAFREGYDTKTMAGAFWMTEADVYRLLRDGFDEERAAKSDPSLHLCES